MQNFLMAEEGQQDVLEYSLLFAALLLVTVGILHGMHYSISGIWSAPNTSVAAAKTAGF